MNTLEGLLRAVIADPADDLARLAYADALEEAGQDARAEFIRVQVELARNALLWPDDWEERYALWQPVMGPAGD